MSKSTNQRKILQQGQLDGFCLLYAVLNAFKSVTNPEQPASSFAEAQQTLWGRLISVTPSLNCFAYSGSVLPGITKSWGFGAGSDTTDRSIKQLLMKQYAEILSSGLPCRGKKTSVRISPVTGAIGNWQSELTNNPFPENKAYILCIREPGRVLDERFGGEHWIAIVGNDDQNLSVACSFISHYYESEYTEYATAGQKSRRYYNNWIDANLTEKDIVAASRYELVYDS